MPEPRVFVAEPQGMLGRAIVRALARQGLQRCVLNTAALDLRQAEAVERFFRRERPTQVFLTAGKKGGIGANQRFPADLLLDNLRVATNVMDAAFRSGVERLLYVGSSCMYPRDCPQPMAETMLLTGPLEPTSAAYAVGKLAGLHLCQAIHRQYGRRFISAIPTNVYGPHDEFDPDNAHVVGALIRKISDARAAGAAAVCLWGTGTPRREFVYCDDFAAACVFLMEHYDGAEPVNIASNEDVSIRELAELIADILGYDGAIRFDSSKPDGMPRKALAGSRLTALGWRPRVGFRDGLRRTCDWYERAYPARSRKEESCV